MIREEDEDMEDVKKPAPQGKTPTPDKSAQLQAIINRMAFTQRRYGMEMGTIKGQTRAYLYAMELKEMGFKAEDIK